MKKNRILSFLLTLFVAFIASISAVSASGWKTEESRCYDHPERALTIHYIVDGKEVNPGDPNAGSWYGLSSTKRNPCTSYSIPEGYYNYNTGFGKSQKMFTNEDGTRGIIYWYDNPEFTGSPVISISYTQIPESREITLYGKTGPIIEVYANGYKKKVVVGRKYSPMTMDPDYSVSTGITHNYGQSVNYWKYSTEADYFSYVTDHGEYNSNPTYTYYRDRTYVKSGSSMLAMPAKYVHVDNTELIQFINYQSCYGNDDYLYCKIADPETGEPMTDLQVQEMLDDEYAYSTVYIHDYSRIPKYYKYFGFIDTQGREYTPEFVMEQEYEGRAFTTIVDGKMSCATDYISPYSSSSYVAKVYNTGITFDGAEFSGDFNTNYLTKLKAYSGNAYYDNDKTNYQFSSCVPYDVNFKYTYKITNPNARWYNVVIEGTDGERVTPGSTYTLPTEGKPKSAEVTVVTLKYQDGETPDDRLVYTKTYTPSGFKIDGVHYDFGQEIVVTRDLYITYDYTFELDGPDLPTPTRENYSFKGWYDMTIGGHLITNPKTLEAKILYAQWNDADTVTIVRPDGIPIELEKGSEYIIPEIYDKDEVVNSKVSFNYNDRSGKVDVSEVITYYTKDGVVDTLHNNQRYACGEKIIANDNMVLVANYVETVKPAKFPSDPERYGHEFLGWFDGVTSSATKYTEYAGNQDLNLYAHWETYIDQISIHYPDYEPYNGATITIDKGENYTLSNILTNNTDLHDVTFNFNDAGLGDSTTPNQVQSVGISKVGNGWFVDGVLYAGGSVITPEIDVWLIEDTIDVEYEPIFPTPADKEWYTFNGWYDEKTGGTKYTSYNVAEEKTFYAHWDEIPSKEITLGEVPSKADTNAATVVFNYNDGVTNNVTKYVTKSYIADGWIVDGEHYYPGDKVTITRTSSITPNYLESLNSVTFPENPTREEYLFSGWYDTSATSGGTKYLSYAIAEDITLYARWEEPSGPTSTILPGAEFAGKIRDLPNIDINAINTFGKATESEYQTAYNMITSSDAYIISTNNSDVPTYLWFVNDRMLYYSEADTIYLNENSSSMFYKSQFKPQFKSIDISGMDSSKVTNMRAMFSGQSYLTTLELGDFKTDNVTNMYYAFNGLNSLTSLDVSSWNTSKVTNMEATFYYCRALEELDVSNWDTSNVTTMYQLFYNMANLKSLDLSKWDVSNVTNMEGMFYLDQKLTSLDLSSFDTEKLQKTANMFARDPNLETIYVSEKWNMSGVTSSYSMFGNSTSIVGQEGTTYDSSHTDKEYARIDEGESNPGYLTYKAYTGKYKITLPDKVIKVPAGSTYEIPENTYDKASANGATVTFVYNNGHENTTSNVETQYLKNGFIADEMIHYDTDEIIIVNSDITLVPDYIESFVGAQFPEPAREGYTFNGWYTLPEGGTIVTSYNGDDDITLYAQWTINIPDVGEEYVLPNNNDGKNPDTFTVTFDSQNGTDTVTSDVIVNYIPNGWLVNGVHKDDGETIIIEDNMTIDGDYNESITSATFPSNPVKDGYLFTGWFDQITGGNKYTSYNKAENITLYAHYALASDVTTYTLGINNQSKADQTIGSVTFKYHNNQADTVSYVIKKFKPKGWLVDGVVHYPDGASILKTPETVITRNYGEYIYNASFPDTPTKSGYEFIGWFTEENGGTEVTNLNQEGNLTLHAHWTDSYAYLIDGPAFSTKIVSLGNTSSNYNFRSATAEEFAAKRSSLGTNNVVSTDNSPNTVYVWRDGSNVLMGSDADIIFANPDMSFMFSKYDQVGSESTRKKRLSYSNINVSGINTSKVVNMYAAFYNQTSNNTLNLGNFNTSNVTNLGYAFYFNRNITSFDISGFDTSKVTNMEYAFGGLSKITSLAVENLDVHNVENLKYTLYGLRLVPSLDVSKWDVSKVTSFYGTFLDNPLIETLDLTSWDTSSAETMNFMFGYLNNLESLDVTSFDTSNVTDMELMFAGPNKLTELDLSSFDTSNVMYMRQMFANASLLKKIYVSDKWSIESLTFDTTVNDSHDMFMGLTSIVGQKGTTFNSSQTGKEYAHVDDAPSNPGYLSYKGLARFYTVTLPDYSEDVAEGSAYIIPDNTYYKDDIILATVTFDYQDGRSKTTSTVRTEYSVNGWTIGSSKYDDGDSIIVNSDITLQPSYIETSYGATFPETPVRPGYVFEGWFTELNGGEKVTEYTGDTDITLYAHWRSDLPEPGKDFILPTNNIAKSDATFTVTFKLQNGEDDIVSTIGKQYIPNGWVVDGKHRDDGEIIKINADTTIEPDYTEVAIGSFPENPTKEGYQFEKWTDAPQGGNVYTILLINKDITLYAQYLDKRPPHIIPEGTKCIRARKDPHPGTYGTDDTTLSANNAFDCDLNGDGQYNERFYYVSDYYDTETGEFNHDYAVLAYSGLVSYGTYYNTQSNVNGPVTAVSELPSTSSWSNVELHKTTRQLRTVNGNSSFDYSVSGVTNLPTINYDGRAARLLTIQEVNEGCGLNIDSGVLTRSQDINNKCSFLLEGLSEEAEEPWDPDIYYEMMYENIIDNSNYYLVLDGDGEEFTYQQDSSEIRPAIEVLKSDLDLAIVPSYYTVTYPNGRVDTASNRELYKLADAMVTKDPDVLSTVTFKPQNGDPDVTSNVTKTYVQNEWYLRGDHYGGYTAVGNSITVDEDLVVSAPAGAFKSTKHAAVFPQNPTKEGYAFNGWFDAPVGGNVYTSYDGTTNKTLYAQYIKIDAEGKITLSKNETPKANQNYIEYEFRAYEMVDDPGTPGEMMKEEYTFHDTYSQKTYSPNGWLVDGVHYDDYDKVLVTSESVITPDYKETIIPGVFPDNYPEDTDGGEFVGWQYGNDFVTSLDFLPNNGRVYAALYPEYTYDYVNLISGSSFNTKLKAMISGSGYNGTNLTFREATATEYNNIKSSLTSANIVSEENNKPAYMWVDAANEAVLYYSEADVIFMNEDSSNMFNNVDELKTVNLSGLNSIKVTNMSGLFSGSDNLSTINLTGINTGKVTNMSNMFSNLPSVTTLSVSGLSTSRVTNMESMFSGDTNLTALDLRSFNTNNVTNMANMFKGDSHLSSIDVTTFNVSSVANMSSMFEGCSSITSLDLSRFKTDALTNASSMFKGASSLTTTDLHNFKTSSVTNMSSMFEGTTSLTTLNISSFDTSSVTNTSNMFKGDSNLTTVYVSSRWNNEGITLSDDMFTGATSIVGQEGTTYSASHTDKEYAVVDKGEERPGYLTFKGVETFKIYIDNVKVQDAVIGEVFVVPSLANKDSETVSTVTFIYNDGNNTTSTSNVVKTYSPAGYSFNDKKYNPEDIITVEEDIYLTSVYTEENVGATFPTPTRDNYTFVGWIKEQTYDPNGSQTKYTSYDGTEDITLYGAWTASNGYHTVTYDNGEVEVVAHGDSITVPTKVSDESETLTFTYTAGTSGSTTTKTFTKDFETFNKVEKYSVNNTDYAPGQNIVINSDVFITRSYNGLSYDDTSFEIPSDAYNFIGWFSSETGGKQISTYKEYKENKLTSGNLYGHHNEDGKFTVVLDGVEVGSYNEGSIYTLPEGVNINEDVATVTFINGETATTAKVHETKTFDYYTVNSFTMVDVIKNVGEELTVNSNIYITSSYKNATLTPVTITDLADTDYEEFAGWYTKQGGEGAKISGTYSDKVDITLYAYFDGKLAKYSFYDNEHQNHIGYKEAKYGTEIDTRDILPIYEVDSEHTITYKLQNGRPQDNYTLNMKATQKIDHWERSTDNKAYALVHTVDVVGPISVHAVFTNELLPNVDLPVLTSDYYPGYDFAGWYDAPIGGKLLTSSDFTEDKDYTVYAHWTRNSDNICTFDDGHTENCPLGETGTIPEEMTTTAAYVNEVANGDLDQYKNYVINGYILEKTSVVEYFIIDGVKYLPGSTYTIGENPSITAKYSDEYIEPVTLSTSIPENTISNYFDDNKTHLFDGWYTGRTDGTRVFTYGEAENKDFYAHYKIYDPEAIYYTLTIEHLDGTIDTIENLTQGEKYTLVKDEYVNRDHAIKLYDSDGTTLLGTTTVKFTHTANKWLINGELRNTGSELTILGDTYIKAYETSSNKEVVGYTEPDNNDFIGYFTEVSGGEKVSVNSIKESDNVINTLYAHYKEDAPTGYVQVDFDGDITNVPEGTNITLPTTRTKNGETFDIIFNFNQGSISSETATVEKSYNVSSYTVNNVTKNPGEVVTANTNLVIRTKYSESYDYSSDTKSYFNVTYPNIPAFDGLELIPDHWVDSMENGNNITNVENIKETTNLYAVYANQANVYLNNEVIATVTVGSKYTLPTNTINKPSDILATVTFNHLNDENTVTTSNRYKLYTPNGWTIGETGYNSGANYLVTEDITLVPRYKETIVEAKMPKDPVKSNADFKGWFTDLEDESTKVTSVDGITEDLTLNALFKDKVKIVDPETGETEYVDEGTVITLESLNDKEEKYHNITFKYNYENAPEDKVVRISTQEIFKGWLINGVLHEAGEEITVNEDITKVASYEMIINNKNLPNDPVRDGYTFTGWYNSASELFGSLVDVTTITTDATVYAHWLNFNPETEVKLTWDGEVTIHDKGEVINLVKENTSYDELIATVMVLYHNSDYGTEELKVNNHHYIDHLVINGNNHEVSGTYTLNEDTVIRSVYDSEIVYPSLPSVDDDDFIGFYTDTIDGEVVTTLEGISEDTVIHARWNSEHSTTNDEIIVTVDGEISLYSKGDTYNLPEAKTKPATGATVTFDPQNGEDVIVKNLGTTYTFTGYRLEEDNVLYDALESFTLESNMTFTSEFTESSEAPTWPNDPTKEHYVFIGWYTTSESGKEVFNYDDITMSTTLYAHYVRDNESFVTLTNTLTGEYIKVLSGDDFVFSDSKFNKELSTKLGTVTFKFNATGYPDEVVEFKSTNSPSGFYVNGDTNNLYSLDQAYQFTENTDITPYFSDETIVKDNHIGLDLFDYDLVNDVLSPICFSKTNQTDENDEADYDCYEEYNEADGDVTVYLHWKDIREVSVTKPDGTVEVFPIYTNYNYGENTIPSNDGINYEVTLKYHDDIHEDEVVRYQTGNIPNGWIVTGSEIGRRHIDDNEVETLIESIVIEPDYEIHESTITLPNPTRDEYNFVGWNKTENGLGKFYTNEELNSVTSSGTLTLHAIWTQDETVTISFDEQGGEEVSDLTKVVGSELGTLPTTKKLGYTFAGWYTDTTYSTKVDEHTVAKYDVTYYARWIEDTFPDLFREDGPVVFDGDDYINTHVMLYSNTDDIWKQDYEIGLTIESYNHDGTEKQGAFVNAKYENESLKWPGLVFRKMSSGNKIEITQNINQGQNGKKEITLPLTYPYEVRIRREDGIVKYSLNGSSWTDLQDMSVFNANQRHNVETFFGAAASSDGITPFRFIKATMSNMYVKRGTIPGANEVTVTYPDGHTVIKNIGDTVDLSEIGEINKPDYKLYTVTFKYQDEQTPDLKEYVYGSYTQNGWSVNGDNSGTTLYASDDVITLSENIIISPSYIETTGAVTFPEDPTYDNHTFIGWFDSSSNGTKYTSYNGNSDITLYAQWKEDLVIPVPGDDPIITPKGSTIQLPENNVAKSSDNASKVTFKPENGSSDIERYVLRAYTPNGWLINGTHYDVGDEYVANEIPTLVPDYVSYIVPVEFPEDPTLTDKDFNGWYTLADGGDKITSYSDDENDLILYAQYVDHVPVIITPGGIEHPDENGNYTFKENIYNKDEELLATVRFVYHNGDGDTYSYVVKQYIKNGWLLDGVHYNTGDVIAVDHDIEIFPDYTESIKPAEFPADPIVDGDTFIGWFSEKTGGTQYTSYSAAEDITLHAQWENGTDIYPTILCKRATTLHTEKCERTGSTLGCAALGYSNGDTIYYGSLGNGNILARGDAFTCDVNGDGTFDEATERFYYMSDYYDVTTDTYDPDYAVMIYYANLYDVGMMSEHGAPFSTGPDDHAPNNIKKYLPTAELWPNTSLKQNIRYVRDYLNEENIEIDYTDYVARLMNFKELGYDANGNQDIIPEMFEKSLFNKPNNYNHPQFAYYLESYNGQGSTNYYSSTQMGVSPSGRVEYADNAIGLRPAIDVSKDRIQLVEGDTYTVSIDGEVVESVKAGTIYTIPENTKAKASDTYAVTFNYHNESPETTSNVEVSYLPNGYNVTDNHYNGGEKVVITGNISLISDYIETVIPASFPADPTKEDLTFVGWFDQETGGNKFTEYSEKADIILHAQYKGDEINIIIPDEPDPIIIPVTPDEPYNLPTNDLDKADENVGSVTFIYNDGETENLTKYVVASYTPNGWLINDVAYDDGAEITPTEDITLVRNYIEAITGIEWPNDPTRNGYGFDGWYTDELLENKYDSTSYSDKQDINLYAKWVEIEDIEVDANNVTMLVGDTHNIEVDTVPSGLTTNYVFTSLDENIATINDSGTITAIAPGTVTVKVSLASNSDIYKEITVTVIGDKLTSDVYTVKDIEKDDQSKDRIVIGAEPNTLISEFKANMTNPAEYIKIYTSDGELVTDDDIIKTGLVIKLEYNDRVLDEAIIILRGDIDGDGLIDVTDEAFLMDHILEISLIDDYKFYAADFNDDGLIDVTDEAYLMDYILEIRDSLNNI